MWRLGLLLYGCAIRGVPRNTWGATIEAMSERESNATNAGLTSLYSARSMWLNAKGDWDQGFEDAKKAVECAA